MNSENWWHTAMFEESTDMDLKTFLDEMDSGHGAVAGSGVHLFMRR
ncbi:hypothetical protein [Bifidobacterium thermophilum]